MNFEKDTAALAAARSGVALYDRSQWGRIEVSDVDRIRFLHNQSTNDFKILKPGEGCDTVFVTSTARTIDLTTAYVLENSVLLLVSPNLTEKLITFLDRYIFFADKVKLADVTTQTATFSLIGSESHALLEKLGAADLIGQPDASHRLLNLAGQDVRVAIGSGLATAGYTLIADVDRAAALQQSLIEAGAVAISDRTWEQLRIEQGRPMPGHELTDDYNPLEAGLWNTISFNKGCYIGQETIARLDTYNGVKQQLWGVQLNALAEPGTVVMVGAEKVGKLTSILETEKGAIGLAYIRTKANAKAGMQVTINNTQTELIDLPFLTREKQP
ncbi:folate-binding protein [Phormidesmis priestleyi ULC007]|uniref:Folate-binding protein n=1 Tax=Phormidesmis priestleyi ULC007 TaxID=1920490 RepID=A0A2T1DEP0_9CYAN|nr:folate-binding protein YgfZ [Phormidesmis priestleyi]PSB18934.1 folate-binding protein [Phormidesmis priestleyi ULC007]PZO53922.1 MAG: folate-binding protein [Phormidesmis priestleyi]